MTLRRQRCTLLNVRPANESTMGMQVAHGEEGEWAEVKVTDDQGEWNSIVP